MLSYRFFAVVCIARLAAGCAAANPTMPGSKDMVAATDLGSGDDLGMVDVDLKKAPPDLAGSSADLVMLPTGTPVLYPADRTQSPLTAGVVANLKNIAAQATAKEDVFAKVGDSNSVLDSYYARCFDDSTLNLDGRTELQATIDYFASGDAAGVSPYDRASAATMIGKTAAWAIAGSPSPIDQELTALSPRYATIMYGSNEIGSDTPTLAQEGVRAATFGGNMLTLVERVIQAGTIPIITAIPPRTAPSPAASDQMVPLFNAVARGIAQAKQIPFIDLERELRPLTNPKYGLVTSDGLHLQRLSAGACVFTAAGLQMGQNVRNLITMQMFARLKAALVDGGAAPDATAPTLAGTGDQSDPFIIDEAGLPFGDLRNTATGGFSHLANYNGGACKATQDESGPEYWYKLVLTSPRTLRALVLDRGTVDIDVHLLDDTGTAAGCLQRDDTQIVTAQLAAGTYYFVLDTFVSSGTPKPGEYLFVLITEP